MGRNDNNSMDLRKIRRLLRETTRLAERASMTGSLQGGGRIAIRQYNAIRNHLQDNEVIPDSLFQALDEDEATFDELGVVTGMLDSYLEEDEEGAPEGEGEANPEDREARRGRRGKRHERFERGLWLGPEGARIWNDPEAVRDLRQMGEDLREHLPDLLKWRESMRGNPPVSPTPPVPPTPPHAHGRPNSEEAAAPAASLDDTEHESQDTTTRLRQISEELQAKELDYSRRIELSRELTDLLSRV